MFTRSVCSLCQGTGIDQAGQPCPYDAVHRVATPPKEIAMPNIEATAKVCHEANRAYCAALGDHSQKPWAEAPEWQRASARKGVQFIADNPGAGPAASHNSWLAEKREGGWKYGAFKDEVNKLHPCFVPYDELPVEQKAKDYIFGAIVRTMLES